MNRRMGVYAKCSERKIVNRKMEEAQMQNVLGPLLTQRVHAALLANNEPHSEDTKANLRLVNSHVTDFHHGSISVHCRGVWVTGLCRESQYI